MGGLILKRLKQKDLKDFRLSQLLTQGGVCPLCKQKIQVDEAVLDHCHKSGHVRRVLHRACNSAEGRVMKWAYTSKHYDPIEFLLNLIDYHKIDYTDQPWHPKHLTPNEKEIKKLTKKQRSMKKQETRDKYQVRIDSLHEMVRRENGYT